MNFFQSITVSRIILFLFIFQMMGIRLFQGVGIVLSTIILFLLISRIRLDGKLFIAFVFSSICGGFQLLKGTGFNGVLNVSFQVFNAILLVVYYSNKNFLYDLKPVLKFFAVQALFTLAVDLFVPKSMFHDFPNGVGYNHFIYIFYFVKSEAVAGIHRLSGLAWEPGCLQLLLNLYLFVLIQDKSLKFTNVLWIVLLILATGSTTGYIILLINVVVYCLLRAKSNIFIVLCVVGGVSIILVPFLWGNISGKLMLETDAVDTSGIIRYRDFYTGLYCLRDYPLLGIDMSDLPHSKVYQALEREALGLTNASSSWYQYFEVAAGGYTNGLFGLTMMWGFVGIFLIYMFMRCSLWKQFSTDYWYIVPVIIFLSLISEPISNTALFWFFCVYDKIRRSTVFSV